MPIATIIDPHTIHVFDTRQFDAAAIMKSGQVFRYSEHDGEYTVIVGANRATVSTLAGITVIKCNNAKFFFNYFDLDTDYGAIKTDLCTYGTIRNILETSNAGGIRILRAPFVEMVVSFIISANNNIKRFSRTLDEMAKQFGTALDDYFAFPTLEQLARITAKDFRAMGCGYRDKLLVRAIMQLGDPDFEIGNLCALSNTDLAKRLQTIAGVGAKVAACIMLFCGDFHRLDVAPRDTWIKRAITELGADARVLCDHPYAGVAQQYVFYYTQHLHGNIDKRTPK